MASLYSERSANTTRTILLMGVFFALVMLIGWGISYYFNDPSLFIIAFGIAVVMNVGSYWFSDKVVLSMTGAKPANRSEHFDLYTIVENLSITAGMQMPKVYIVNDPAPNAFATGRDEKHAVVAVTTGLLGMLEKNELEGVIAHELSHIKNRDMLVMTVAVVLAGFVAIVADMFLRASMFGGNRDSDNGKAGALFLVLAIVSVILAPLAAQLIQMAISRKREFLADASGALLTRYPQGLASALEKISGYAQPMRNASHATAHLFIGNPFGAKAGSFVNTMFSTHPPTQERVKRLRQLS
jgi:heat shock protein HtpX